MHSVYVNHRAVETFEIHKTPDGRSPRGVPPGEQPTSKTGLQSICTPVGPARCFGSHFRHSVSISAVGTPFSPATAAVCGARSTPPKSARLNGLFLASPDCPPLLPAPPPPPHRRDSRCRRYVRCRSGAVSGGGGGLWAEWREGDRTAGCDPRRWYVASGRRVGTWRSDVRCTVPGHRFTGGGPRYTCSYRRRSGLRWGDRRRRRCGGS